MSRLSRIRSRPLRLAAAAAATRDAVMLLAGHPVVLRYTPGPAGGGLPPGGLSGLAGPALPGLAASLVVAGCALAAGAPLRRALGRRGRAACPDP